MSWQPPGVENKPNAAGVINDEYFDVRIFDDDDDELPRGTDGEIVLRPKRPHTMFEGYWGRPEATVETSRELVVPHRRHRPDRRRRLPVLRRPQGRLPAPPGREHLELRGRAHPHVRTARWPTSPCTRCRAELTEDDLKITATLRGGRVGHRGGAVPLVHRRAAVLRPAPLHRVPGRAAPHPRSAACSSASCATRASPPATWDAEASGITYEKR